MLGSPGSRIGGAGGTGVGTVSVCRTPAAGTGLRRERDAALPFRWGSCRRSVIGSSDGTDAGRRPVLPSLGPQNRLHRGFGTGLAPTAMFVRDTALTCGYVLP